ncbi:ABC transporter permease [Patescibacteria group bacterium]|nr:ABC transporter permease [Patescibacteria group bacterium]MCL5010108.1 ABC transporter permease [Patescibacteria group bacterium]
MLNFNRILAIIYRYRLNMQHSFDRLTDMFYWPAMDLFVWGLTGYYFAGLSKNSHNAIIILLTGIIYWLVVWRAQYEITVNLLSEMWDQNLVNIFASPLTVGEWISAVVIFGLLKMLLSLAFSGLLALLLYHYPLFIYGFYTIPIILSLILTGWALGFTVAGFIIRFGQKIQTIAWMGAFVIAPFSALYYPVAILPSWAQKISVFVPTSYMFETMRGILLTGNVSLAKFAISFGLNIIYLTLAVVFFIVMFNKSKTSGLSKLI